MRNWGSGEKRNHPAVSILQEPAGWLRDEFEIESGGVSSAQLDAAFQLDQLEARRESVVCWELVGW